MAKLPVVSGKELIKALEREGFQIVRQKGSHVSLNKGEFRTVVLCTPIYQKEHYSES
ncbi:MAG TPA: type II toxin-antitoxin system HicA family toxin [Ignavibacteriaceae bacterium]|nr:type II toxin-antitoxin system HicA family toxin [Ignavibacteriaceae bacterium]